MYILIFILFNYYNSSMSSTKVIDIFNNLNLVSNFNANGLTSGSNLVTISQYGILSLYSTQSSTDANTGALVLPSGGLAINSGVNATGTAQGGSLTVGGGGAFSQDVYIGGNLTVTGSILYANAASSSSTFAYLTLTATDNSINGSTGALITIGGISIQANGNATSSTSGGGLTVSGGIATNRDLYVGGKANLPNIQSINISSSNVVFGNITSSTLNLSGSLTAANTFITSSTITNLLVKTSLNASGNSNTIANIFTTGGNIGINTTSPSYILDITGNLRVNSSSLNIISGTTTTDIIQIQNTNASGASTLQFLNNLGSSRGSFGIGNSNNGVFSNTAYLSTISGIPIQFLAGGNTNSPIIINSADNSLSITTTTISTSTSSGSLKVSGGAGISGNLYVGGGLYVNSQIAANITNTTTSLNSTTGAFLLSGGLSINILSTSNANATSYTSGGGLTIAGGTSISQNVYIGGTLDIQSGSNNLNSISLQSIQIYSNSNNGAYSVIGSGNSSRTTSSFTPIRFTGWNDQSNPKLTINTNTIDIINSVNAINNSNTIGSLFTTGGNIGIGTTQPSFNLDVVGNINFSGALYKSNSLYVSSQWLTTSGNLSYTSGNVVVTGLVSNNSSLGTINSTGLTTGNINFTGNLYQNGTAYLGSQWTTTNGNLSYTTGNVIMNSITTANINFTGSLYQNGISYLGSQWTTSAGNLTYTSGTVIVSNLISSSNLQSVNLTTGTLNVINGLTTGNINFTGSLYQNGVSYLGSQWTGTNGSLLYYGTTSNIFVGIGTSNPSYTLSVNGIVSATGLAIIGTANSLNSTTGQYIFNSVSLSSTQDVSSFTQGGALTIAGGVAFGKSIAITGSINYSGITTDVVGTFNGSNNISTASNITSLLFPTANIRSFTTTVSIQLLAGSGNLYSHYTIEGIQNTAGWFIDDTYVGDATGITFSITNTGQIQYTSTNITGWISTTMNYRSSSYSISGNYIQSAPPTSGNFLVTQNLTVQGTTDATSASYGSFVTSGGAGIGKSVNIGGSVVINNVSSMSSGTFSALNGTITNGIVTGLLFTSTAYRSFSIIMSVSVLRTSGGNLNAQYTMEGIQKDSGWFIYVTSLGDTIDLIFSINNTTGQLQYSSSTLYTNWTSTTFNYQTTVIYISGGFSTFNLPSGSQSFNGILSISNSTDSIDSSTGSLIVSGGVAIQKNLNVGLGINSSNINLGISSFYTGSFIASNNSSTPNNVSGLTFLNTTIRYFEAKVVVSISLSTGSSTNTIFTLRGNQNDSSWDLYSEYIGDASGISFTITTTGQVQYTSTNVLNFTSSIFRYSVQQFTKTGVYTSSPSNTSGSYLLNSTQITSTTDAVSGISVGALQVLGGSTISKNLIVNGNISANSFIGAVYTTQNTQSTLSRTFSIVYQNTSPRSIFISICMNAGSTGEVFTAYTDTNTTPTTIVTTFSIYSNGGNMSFIVLPGYYYRVTRSSTGTVLSWSEWS